MVATIFLAMIASVAFASDSPNCLSDSGANVDWFIALKGSNSYEYFLSTSRSKSFSKSPYTLDDPTQGAISLTIAQAYPNKTSSLFWNDQSPDGKSHDTFGHTKGVIAFDATAGYWLIHSVPRYPNTGAQYEGYPEYAKIYAQSFLCISVNTATLDTIGRLLQWYRPHIHDQNLIDADVDKLPELHALAIGAQVKDPPTYTTAFKSKGGVTFVGIGTAAAWARDIYYEGVALYYKDNVMANTWMNGKGAMESYCKPEYQKNVRNIRQISVDGSAWSTTQDHSKWAITDKTPNACVGGKNRQISQMTRQGGIVCFEDAAVHDAFKGAIAEVDSCTSYNYSLQPRR